MAKLEHHKREEYCKTRLKYRSSRNPTAIKVYTVASESRYLFVFGVPKINLISEIRCEFQRYGPLQNVTVVTDEISRRASSSDFKVEQFTDVFRVVFAKLENARKAKKFSDAKNFYGGILHISYAPECEGVDDLRKKLTQRKKEVMFQLRKHAQTQPAINTGKRKFDLESGYVDSSDYNTKSNKYTRKQ